MRTHLWFWPSYCTSNSFKVKVNVSLDHYQHVWLGVCARSYRALMCCNLLFFGLLAFFFIPTRAVSDFLQIPQTFQPLPENKYEVLLLIRDDDSGLTSPWTLEDFHDFGFWSWPLLKPHQGLAALHSGILRQAAAFEKKKANNLHLWEKTSLTDWNISGEWWNMSKTVHQWSKDKLRQSALFIMDISWLLSTGMCKNKLAYTICP